jgi:hypothetical protein
MKFITITTLSIMFGGAMSASMESNCTVSYRLYDTDLNMFFSTLVGEDNISYPPCNINIEAVVSCSGPVEEGVRITLRAADGSLVKSKKEQLVPYFLFGDYKGNVRSARLEGKYTIQTFMEAVETPPISFTMYPCVDYSP